MTSTIDAPVTTTASTSTTDEREAFVERVLTDYLGGLETFAVHLGIELGLYAGLADQPATATALASRTGVARRYVREWLEQQTTAGLVRVNDPLADADQRRYTLPDAHAEVLLDTTSPFFAGGVAGFLGGVGPAVPDITRAYRTGGGVSFGDYGDALRNGLATLNEPSYAAGLAASWLPAMPDVHARLSSHPAPRILDLGCGAGGSTVALARAYPRAQVVGIDLDVASVVQARERVRREGLGDRVHIRHDTATIASDLGTFDLVTILEALHDMADPVDVLRAARTACGTTGSVLVADMRVADELTPDGDLVERLSFAASVLHCLPATKAEEGHVAHGTVLRAPTVHRWAHEAGFAGMDELDVEHLFWRFYRLDVRRPGVAG